MQWNRHRGSGHGSPVQLLGGRFSHRCLASSRGVGSRSLLHSHSGMRLLLQADGGGDLAGGGIVLSSSRLLLCGLLCMHLLSSSSGYCQLCDGRVGYMVHSNRRA
jgi:hypothetical protein